MLCRLRVVGGKTGCGGVIPHLLLVVCFTSIWGVQVYY